MFELIIKRQDGSLYWIERFNSMAALDSWLTEECTRPYWDKSFTWETKNNTPLPDKAEEDRVAVAKAELLDTQKKIIAMNENKNMNTQELNDILKEVVKLLKHIGAL